MTSRPFVSACFAWALANVAFAQSTEPPAPSDAASSAVPPSDVASEGAPPDVAAPAPSHAAPAAPVRRPPAEPVVEVTVRGGRSEAQRLTRSAEAVTVIDTRRAKQQTADLGEVLARTQGITIRRDGGLGSPARFSLNGLQNEQIRFFLDGVPLDVAGYPFGVANVPVNLVERVEVYRGVVPIRFGADALGGALNLATDTRYETHAAASYQVGSFGTHRATVSGRYRHDASGFVMGASAFADKADNDYRVDVLAPEMDGTLRRANVRRFHDGYLAFGGTVEAGVVERPWAKRLLVRAYATTYDKELQHNIVMAVPYGEVASGENVYGANARYDVDLASTWKLETVASYAHRTIDFVDKAPWVYNWFGERVRSRPSPGELNSQIIDQTVRQHTAFARALLSFELATRQFLRASITPTFARRSGEQRVLAPGARDPLSAERDLFTFVSGLEYELNLFAERLSNVAFLKDYVYRTYSEEALPSGVFVRADRSEHRAGAGDALRVRIAPWLYLKASYEYATRLPGADEVFGNGVFIGANLGLKPEVSHNGNFGPHIELRTPGFGQLTYDLNGFVRMSNNLIVLRGYEPRFSYWNVYQARSLGLENALAWLSPGRWVALDGAFTWQDIRNVSERGTFRMFKGERVPNRPYLFASWGARLRFGELPGVEDSLEPYYVGRYVHAFLRDFAGATNETIPTQIAHNLGLTYAFVRDLFRGTATFEISNISDAKVYDNFGVQKPGRAYYFKLTGEL